MLVFRGGTPPKKKIILKSSGFHNTQPENVASIFLGDYSINESLGLGPKMCLEILGKLASNLIPKIGPFR